MVSGFWCGAFSFDAGCARWNIKIYREKKQLGSFIFNLIYYCIDSGVLVSMIEAKKKKQHTRFVSCVFAPHLSLPVHAQNKIYNNNNRAPFPSSAIEIVWDSAGRIGKNVRIFQYHINSNNQSYFRSNLFTPKETQKPRYDPKHSETTRTIMLLQQIFVIFLIWTLERVLVLHIMFALMAGHTKHCAITGGAVVAVTTDWEN